MAFFEFLAAKLDALSGKFIKPIGGQDSSGNARPILSDYRGTVFIEGSDRLTDSFNRFRVSMPFGLFDAKQVLDNSPNFYGTILAGSGTAPHSTDECATTMTLTTASGDSVTRQSLAYIPYQPGRSQQIFMTGVMGAIKTNVRQRIGYFDDNNGIFYEQDGTNLRVVRRTHVSGSPVDNAINQSSWNIDKLDGTGRSGITLDTSKNQIFVFDFGWLGVDFIRFGFVINGELVYCHKILNSNVLTHVWCSMPMLPVRWEITNTGTAGSGTTMLQVCAAVFSEGGADALGLLGSANTGTTHVAVTNLTPTPILSIRLKSGFKRAALIPQDVSIAVQTADYYLADIYVGGTLSGGSAVVTAITEAVESVTGNTTLTGGRKIGGFVGNSTDRGVVADLKSQRLVSSDISGTPELVTIVITPLTGNTNYFAAMNWREIY